MLQKLIIKNYAIIKDIEIEFQDNLNVLTGQTGAGKSLIIDTINLLMGARASLDMIRNGEKEAKITAYFTNKNPKLSEYLENLNINNSDILKLERIISTNNKSRQTINDINISLVNLKEISSYLVDLYMQHDLFKFFNKESYFDFIDDDSLDKLTNLKNDYLLKLVDYKALAKEYNDLLNYKKDSDSKLEFLQYEYEELANLNLKENEDEEIKQELVKLKNYDHIHESLTKAYEYLNNNTLDNLYEVKNSLDSISELDINYKKYSEILNNSYYELDDLKSSIYKELEVSSFDKDEYDRLEERDFLLTKIKNKYHKTINELIKRCNDLEYEIEKITNYDSLLKNSLIKLNKAKEELYNVGLKIHQYRLDKAAVLTNYVTKEAINLELDYLDLKVEFKEIKELSLMTEKDFYDNGLDEIEFMISFNKGESLKPLIRVASGGEMSRLMLIFKALKIKNKILSLVVFDEIDTGLSGEAALKLALKIKEIAKTTQVLSISHLPQLAALANHQYLISKETINEETISHINLLKEEERIKVIAEMISGKNISAYAINYAKELLNNEKNH